MRVPTTITLGVVSSLAAIVGACTAFSSESGDTPDAGAVEDARSTDAPVSSSTPDTSTPDAGTASPRRCSWASASCSPFRRSPAPPV